MFGKGTKTKWPQVSECGTDACCCHYKADVQNWLFQRGPFWKSRELCQRSLTLACRPPGWRRGCSRRWCSEGALWASPSPVPQPPSACGSAPGAGWPRTVQTAGRRQTEKVCSNGLRWCARGKKLKPALPLRALFLSLTSQTSQTEWMKPFHSSRASALGTCGENQNMGGKIEWKLRNFTWGGKGRRDYSDLLPHSELDVSILQLEVESGCLQVPILAAVVR